MEAENKKDTVHLGRLNLEKVQQLSKGAKNHQKFNSISDDDLKSWLALSEPYIETDPFKLKDNIILNEPDPKFFDRNYLQLTFDQVKNLPTDDLYKLLSGESHSGAINEKTVQLISNEILSRQIQRASKPHWTVKPTFYAVIFFGLITIVIGILSLLK